MLDSSEFAPPQDLTRLPDYQIRKGAHFDLIINNTSDNPRVRNALLAQVQNGIPQSWINLSTPRGMILDHILVDSMEPHFLAKVKKVAIPQKYQQTRAFETVPEALQFLRARNSVLNEIALSPKIKNLVASPEFQNIVKRNGYDAGEFVEPLLASIDRRSGQKVLFYEWKEHACNISLKS